ncbi:MAG: hypothetical protein R3C20_25415 [Planctomycetaceae bacterium]
MTFATIYEGYDLAFIGVPVAIIAALILFALLINSLINMLTATTSRNLKVGMAVLFFTYVILCPGLSGSAWFNLSSPHATTAEYSWFLMICFAACCFVVAAIALLNLQLKRRDSSAQPRSVPRQP